MRGASAGKTMYVIPYLMAPPCNALAPYAAGVQLTDARTVVLHMIRMSRVGIDYLENLEEPHQFVRAVHVTGDLENLGQGTPDDQRDFGDRRRRAQRSCTSDRPTVEMPCSARLHTDCARPHTTAGSRGPSLLSSTC